MVVLWKIISIKFLIFWAYSRLSTSKLIFFKDWPFDHLWPFKKVRRNRSIWLKIGIRFLGTQRLHPCKFKQNRTEGHILFKVCEILYNLLCSLLKKRCVLSFILLSFSSSSVDDEMIFCFEKYFLTIQIHMIFFFILLLMHCSLQVWTKEKKI